MKVFLTWILLIPLTICAETPLLSVTQAIDEALQNNRQLSRETIQTRVAQVALDVAVDEFSVQWDPFIRTNILDGDRNSSAGVGASKKLKRTNGTLTLGAESAYTENSAEPWRPAISAEWRQPLLRQAGSGSALLSSRQTRGRWMNAQRALHEQRAQLVLQVMEAFESLRLLMAREQLEADRTKQLSLLHRLALARERQGRGSRIDTLRADQQRVESATRLAHLQEQTHLSRSTINDLMGRPAEALWIPEDLALPLPDLPETTDLLAVALSNRLDLARSIETLTARNRDANEARRDILPQLDLILRYERFDLAEKWSGDGFEEDQWLIGFSGSQGLSRAQREAALEEAGLMRDDATLAVASTALNIQREIYQQSVSLRQAKLAETGASQTTTPAEKRLRLAERLFEMGRGSHFDVADAETSWATAQLNLLEAQTRSRVAHLRLRHALGVLLAVPTELVANLQGHTPTTAVEVP